jgi:shikimate dehydrogenase
MNRKAAVLGSPISHSLSPVLHRAAYAELGLDIDYTAVETSTDLLPQRIRELDTDCVGYSITMPLKQEVLKFISRQSQRVSNTGCANTVYRDAQNQWALENTDVFGIMETIKRAHLGGLTSACIIGSGATASSALNALGELGVHAVTCLARNHESVKELRTQGESLEIDFQTVGLGKEITLMGDLVISTVPSSAQASIIDKLTARQNLPALLDIAYNPWPSDLSRHWNAQGGGPVLSGIEMLLWQASAQVQLFTGIPAPIAAMRAALPQGLSTT